ncbi:MAG: SGNH/GDSL hydrolase family protein [Eubacteriales bacterium]|nr:SGNH/GDSL hydrolase family protein [Eubacteriales bacterium]
MKDKDQGAIKIKTVLLIGDSIRLGYQQRVQNILGDVANVIGPNENCRFTKYSLWGISAWIKELGNPKIDLIHWNNGIWDLHRVTSDGFNFSSIDEYICDNERLCIEMQRYCNNLVWATTIPGGRALDKLFLGYTHNSSSRFDNQELFLCAPQHEWNDNVMKYNEAATKILCTRGVVINDLFSILLPDLDNNISDDGIHPTELGNEKLAMQVAQIIRQQLNQDL